ncbi:MAG: DNA repair protein RecN [Clostridia bacterium]|nr:DNA repair protein RecN [Clostridia bacterium]
MLNVLHIENIAVIEQADIQFDAGFNVLTGETGAGKSIVIDAISAILGERTSRDMIRTGAEKSFVSAVFSGVKELAWFAENGVDFDPEELLIQREILADGKNNCRVNGRPVTVALLRKLGLSLIGIHGQHDSQQLFDEATHLLYLDAFAHDESELSAYSEVYEKTQDVLSQIRRLTMDEAEKLRRVETLEYQIAEIEKAELEPGEEEQLDARRKLLQNAEKLTNSLECAVSALYGDESSDGAAGLLSEAEHELSRVRNVSDSVLAIYQKVSDLMYSVQDTAEELRDLKAELEFSPDELEEIEERLDVIHKLKRKYGGSVEAVLAFLESAKTELDEIAFSSDRVEALQKKLLELQREQEKAGIALRIIRFAAAQELENRIRSELAELDMPGIQFLCQFSEQSPAANGMDEVRFLMSANKGESLKPMAKVASGGELARIMLAMKNVLATQDEIPTLIFDEVDAGVSGRAAQKVAGKLSTLARQKQVLCVTHLPQIAAMADTHLQVAKQERQGRTFTSVSPLDHAGRTDELARLIGGSVITENTRRSAEEMLSLRA